MPGSSKHIELYVFCSSTKIALDTILDDEKFKFVVRKTKIICTMGPKCWSEEMLAALLDKGMNVARLNFSHGTHDQHYEVLARFRKVSVFPSAAPLVIPRLFPIE